MPVKRTGTSTITWGEFNCPTCKNIRKYVRKEVWETSSTTLSPVDTLKMAGEFLECSVCKDTFETDVLTIDPSTDQRPPEAIYRSLMLKVMVVMMETDRQILQDEIVLICDIYEEMIGFRLPDRILENEINAARATERDAFDLVRAYAPRLNAEGCEKVLRAAYHIATADGAMVDRERDFLTSLGVAMGMSLKQIDDILDAARREGWTDFRKPR